MTSRVLKVVRDFGIMPTKGTQSSAGWDLYFPEDIYIEGNSKVIVNLGIKIELPEGTYGEIKKRSNLGKRKDLCILIETVSKNYVNINDKIEETLSIGGIIDCDYRGYIHLIIHNLGDNAVKIKAGESFAQLIICNIIPVELLLCSDDQLQKTNRNEGGFGSTLPKKPQNE